MTAESVQAFLLNSESRDPASRIRALTKMVSDELGAQKAKAATPTADPVAAKKKSSTKK